MFKNQLKTSPPNFLLLINFLFLCLDLVLLYIFEITLISWEINGECNILFLLNEMCLESHCIFVFCFSKAVFDGGFCLFVF